MNPRIRELADKIWEKEYWDNPNTDKLLPAQLNKFSELIVRECGQTLVDNTPAVDLVEEWDRGYDRAMNDCILLLYKHFGVEE